jgi:serine-type D-Ala-D-Ala carboxypeptidase
LGNAVLGPQQIAATSDTIYDLASITKVLVTALLCARAIDDGRLTLDHRLAALMPQFDLAGKRTILIRDLLAHTSHMTAWKPLYLLVESPDDVIEAIASAEPDLSTPVIYSDLNFIVLGRVLEGLYDQPLDRLFSEACGRLGLTSTMFRPPAELRHRVAASEDGNEFEKNTCADEGYSFNERSFRSDLIWGEVHDGNAHFMGGVAGHAGLFSTAAEVTRLAQQFLPTRSELLSAGACHMFMEDLTPDGNEHRSAGFQLASTEGSTAGPALPPMSFGHNGFTGTSVWIDPVKERTFVLLTNRTHNSKPPFVNINSVRRRFHEVSVEVLSTSVATKPMR